MNNSTNNRWLSVLTLLLLTANIVTLALLWMNKSSDKGDRQLPPPGGGQVFEFLTHELNLDSSQQETYKKLRDEHRAGVKPLQDSIRKAKDAFFGLMKEGNITDSTVADYSKKASDAVQQLDIFTFKHFQKLRAICTTEQQKKFDNIIQDVLKRMGQQRQQGPPPPNPPQPGMERGDNRLPDQE